jgi:hypothetical protein
MIRRRRPVREIAFSFDSFLDVVANVVGIIIRLILVVWVGARSYSSLTSKPPRPRPVARVDVPVPEDPLQGELARHRQELAAAQARLLEQLRQVGQVQTRRRQTGQALAALADRHRRQGEERARVEQALAQQHSAGQTVVLSLAEIRAKGKRLAEEIRALEKLPRITHTLHYYTPVSAPVDAEEFLFECHNGRVTFIDVAALLAEVKSGLDDKGKQLETRWQVEDVAGPVGAFRMHYTIERQRGLFDTVGSAPPLSEGSGFRYGLSEWHLEAIAPQRGETEAEALAAGSEFRHVVDGLDPRQAVVTIWVYADSFAVYRRLRDYLYERDIVVAGRPLPEGVPISGSRHGSRSRGQ